MNLFLQDVVNQGQHIKRALDFYSSFDFLNTLDEISKLDYSKFVFIGMGSSNYASIGASMFLNENKVNSTVISAGQFLYYGLNMLDDKTLIIIVSQSGESAEIINILNRLENKYDIVCITNNAQSTLAKKSKFCLYLNVENEVTVSSRTYTATFIVTNLLARYIAGCKNNCMEDLRDASESLSCFIEEYKDRCKDISEFIKDVKFISAMGRGASYGSALAGGLFLKEASKFPSEGTDSAEFRHGPIEVVDDKFGAIVFAPEGRTVDLSIKIARDIAVKGGKVLLVTDKNGIAEDKNIFVLKYEKVKEYLAPIIEIAGIQLLCVAVAEVSGITPGEFRWASKVTVEE